MTGGFGFPNYATQKKTPSSQAVGAALLQRRQQAPAGPAPVASPTDESFQLAPPGASGDLALRDQGAQKMTGPGQIDDSAGPADDAHSANAINVAVGEALTRMGGGYATNPNPYKDRSRNMQLVRQLGLSEIEAQLLAKTGGL